MTIYLTIFSLISNLVQFGAELVIFVFNTKINSLLYGWFRFAYLFIIVFKNFVTIIFYYNFNSNFKNVLLSFLCIKKKQNR